jgi:CRISPR/Cas system CMR-associated protein Cmr5 small subunit
LNIDSSNDFYIDAFWAFQVYLRLFNKQDSHVVKRETERIMSITQWSVRNQTLEALGI